LRVFQLIKILAPPANWQLVVVVCLGTFCGLSLFILYSAKAFSYLSDDPAVCVNCHIMAPQYASWFHSAHRNAATCNDCHVPHDNLFRHYAFKAQDGLRHATMFTFRLEPQVIRIKEAGRDAVQENCLRCHGSLLELHASLSGRSLDDVSKRLCWECHRETPHGRERSLSSVPYARVPRVGNLLPEWLRP
jgi:cytochrome c nitrite reductase small subunit